MPSVNSKHVWHLYVVRVKQRKNFIRFLERNKIEYLMHYPIPPHKQKAFKELNHKNFLISEEIHKSVISIPCGPHLSHKEVQKVISVCNRY